MMRTEKILMSSLKVAFGIYLFLVFLAYHKLSVFEAMRQTFHSPGPNAKALLPRKSLLIKPQDYNGSVHDKRSLTSYMWLRGKPFNLLYHNPPDVSNNITIDAVSIGTKFNIQQMEGQANSWASHWSMRYLFGTTERDDADPQCFWIMKKRIFEKIFPRCACMKYGDSPLKGIRKRYPIPKWIEKENKTKGWLCAQQRFAHAVGKVGRFYQRQGSLPDYLMIQDDDTWWGMNQMISFLSQRDQSEPFVAAGCMIQWPASYVNFSFPFGGFGLVLNRRSIERLIQPIYCNRSTTVDSFTAHACARLEENLVGEQMAFQDGMSVSDIMDRHAELLPYRKFFGWDNDPGYCMLGDWVLGFYANYYQLGSRTDPKLDYIHINKELGYDYNHRERSCLNTGEVACRSSPTQHVCHRIKPDAMLQLHEIDAEKATDLSFKRELSRTQPTRPLESTQDRTFSLPRNVEFQLAPKVDVHESTIFSHMWYRGKVFDQLRDPRPQTGDSFTIDALSIGSLSTVGQMKGQALSWASHPNVRFLFGTTEHDDADPQCQEKLEKTEMHDILSRCSTTEHYSDGLKPVREMVKAKNWTQNEDTSVGWLCAQQRLAHSIGKVGRFYRKEGWLPEYLIIQEDDTWLGMNQIIRYLQSRNNSGPFASAGCMIHWLMNDQDFSYPYGGFGFMINRHSIERLIQPIYCNETDQDAYTERVCIRVRENLMGELMAFEDGMSISDVMDRHAAMLPYRKYRTWDKESGYCMMGNWVLGYYANYYALGALVSPEHPFLHIDSRLGYNACHPGRSCANNGPIACGMSKTRYSCRRLTPEDMLKFTTSDNQRANDTKYHYM